MPTAGECSGCLRAPVPRLRFNVAVEDRDSSKLLTQLMCGDCAWKLISTLVGKSVERTPQRELDELRITIDTTPLHNGVNGDVA